MLLTRRGLLAGLAGTAARPKRKRKWPVGMQPDQQGVFFQLVIQGGGTFTYDASGNLRSANVGQTITDPIQGITCYAGFSTFNGHGAVISLFSSTLDAQFWYADTGSSSQGALTASVSSAASGTDPFGNGFIGGDAAYVVGGGGIVTAAAVTGGVLDFYTAASAAGPFTIFSTFTGIRWQAAGSSLSIQGNSLSIQAATTVTGDATLVGAQTLIEAAAAAAVTSALLEIQGNLAFGGTTAATTAQAGTDASGYPQVTDAAGLQLQVSGSHLAGANTANVTTTANTPLGFMTVPANDVEAGSSYSGHASGSFSTGATAPSSATFRVYWGGVAGTVIASLAVPTLNINLSGLSWYMDYEANWMSTTEVEVTIKVGFHTASGVANSVQYFAMSQTSALTTTTSQNLSMAFQWGSAPGGQQLLCDVARTGRIA